MGYSVYWANERWQGYGVTAPCDFIGCNEEIHRGLGWQIIEDEDNEVPNFFGCNKHDYQPLKKFEINLEKESKEWLNHVLTDDSWKEWRLENPELEKKYQLLKEGN